MTIASKIETFIDKSSWIRKMFEEGTRLKAIHGADKVYDFSLGNPSLSPPEKFKQVLVELATGASPKDHAYMPNTGYPAVRQAVANYLTEEQGVSVSENDLIMTCGAAGALNVAFKSLIDSGDEIITPAPYFVEYNFYADNHGGVLKTVPTHPDFTLDLSAMEKAINEKTKVILINSPNNPTGQVYDEQSLNRLGQLLTEKSAQYQKTIYLISDEPYRKIVYDNVKVPSIFTSYDQSLIAASYSKDISIPGERIGYLVVNPKATYRTKIVQAMALANRILGFVNAPALMQRVVAQLQGACGDVSEYKRKRDLLCKGLSQCGYEFDIPKGAFYLFVRAPIADDVKFVQALQEQLVLVVPGSGFGGPGHFRISYCVEDQTITNAMPGFRNAISQFK